MNMTSPFILRERPLPSSPWLCDDHGCMTTVLDLTHRLPELVAPFTFTGVLLNGVPLKFRALGSSSLAVSPQVPREGDRLDILGVHGKAPASPCKAPTAARSHHPSPKPAYGLQAPQNPRGPRP